MRVLAARFPDRQRASAALEGLRRRLRLAEDAAAIAPMGTPGQDAVGDETVLAGHFSESETGVVRSLVDESGGEVVADVDELWTRSRISLVSSPAPAARFASPPPTKGRREARPERQPIVG